MTKRKLWVLGISAAVVAVLTAATASSIYNVVERGGVYFNATTMQKTDVTGNAAVYEQYPDRNFKLYAPSIISARMSANIDALNAATSSSSGIRNRDSTVTPINVQGCNNLALFIYPSATSLNGDSLLGARLAIQVRMHYSALSDSQNTFIVRTFSRTGVPSFVADSYSTVDSTAVTDSSKIATPLYRSDDIGSMYDLFNNESWRYRILSVPLPGERTVWVNAGSATGFRGIVVPLRDAVFGSITAPYISVRIRCLNTYVYSSTAGRYKFLTRADSSGTSTWPTGTSSICDPSILIRADLVGWR
jgi:hypothetical protein